MKTSFVSAALLLAGSVSALPTWLSKRQSTNIDATVLQFALTLEHLENVFYKQALQKFSQADFAAAGFSATYYNNLKYIASDEQQHVQLLTTALAAAGAQPVAPCTYNFAFTDVMSFITLSSVLEGVGTSAYLGAAPLVTSKAYLTVAGSILVTEALHTSYQRAAAKEVPFPNAYGTPLGPNPVFTLAASFIKSCPASNAPLPFKAFPALTGPSGMVAVGNSYQFKTTASTSAGCYVTFVSGLAITSVPVSGSGSGYVSAAVPATAAGQTYVFITSSAANGTLADASIIAGPAIIEVTPPAPAIDYNQAK